MKHSNYAASAGEDFPRRQRRDWISAAASAPALALLLVADLVVVRQASADLVERPDAFGELGIRSNHASVENDAVIARIGRAAAVESSPDPSVEEQTGGSNGGGIRTHKALARPTAFKAAVLAAQPARPNAV